MSVAYLGYEIDSTGVVRASGDLDKMTAAAIRSEQASKKLTAEVGRSVRSGGAVAAVSKEFEELKLSVDSGYAAAQKWQSVQKSVAAAVSLGSATQSEANSVLELAKSKYLGVATAAESKARAERDATAATVSAKTAYDNLRASIDPLYAVSKQYEAQLEVIANAERTGAITANEAAMARKRSATLMTSANAQMVKFGKSTGVSASQTA